MFNFCLIEAQALVIRGGCAAEAGGAGGDGTRGDDAGGDDAGGDDAGDAGSGPIIEA